MNPTNDGFDLNRTDKMVLKYLRSHATPLPPINVATALGYSRNGLFYCFYRLKERGLIVEAGRLNRKTTYRLTSDGEAMADLLIEALGSAFGVDPITPGNPAGNDDASNRTEMERAVWTWVRTLDLAAIESWSLVRLQAVLEAGGR